MKHRCIIPSALLLILTATLSAQDPFRFPEGSYKQGSLKYVNGLPVLTLKGTPEEMGEQAAKLVAGPSKRLLNFPEELLNSLATPAVTKLLKPQLLKTG